MGPGGGFVRQQRGPTDPPLFEPDQDLLIWRKKVATWVDLISTAAEKGSDRLYKTVYATLARQLYDRGLQQSQRSIVDEAQRLGKDSFDYKQDDQVLAVKQIVDLIAKDPPIAVVTRLIDSFNKVVNCKRGKDEDMNRYLAKYRGFAAEHLMLAGSMHALQIGEVLAITLLKNANLSEATLTTAKLQLIQLAESRQEKTGSQEDKIEISKDDLEALLNELEDMSQLSEEMKVYRSDKRPLVVTKFASARNKMKSIKQSLEGTHFRLVQLRESQVTCPSERDIIGAGQRCVISLDDAVSVIQSLAQTTNKAQSSQQMTHREMQTAVSKEVKSLLSKHTSAKGMSSSSKGHSNRSKGFGKGSKRSRGAPSSTSRSSKKRRGSNGQTYEGSGNSIVAPNVCRDCGSDRHVRGDSDCEDPSFMTRKIRQAKASQQDQAESHDEDEGRHVGHIRPGSTHTQGK